MTQENLTILLPKAMDLGDTIVGSRAYDLQVFAYIQNMYSDIHISQVNIIPNFAPVQVWIFRQDVELGRHASKDGKVQLDLKADSFSSTVLRFYNLSIDTEVTLSVAIEGRLHNAVSW